MPEQQLGFHGTGFDLLHLAGYGPTRWLHVAKWPHHQIPGPGNPYLDKVQIHYTLQGLKGCILTIKQLLRILSKRERLGLAKGHRNCGLMNGNEVLCVVTILSVLILQSI